MKTFTNLHGSNRVIVSAIVGNGRQLVYSLLGNIKIESVSTNSVIKIRTNSHN